jgi:hypothetical protein
MGPTNPGLVSARSDSPELDNPSTKVHDKTVSLHVKQQAQIQINARK